MTRSTLAIIGILSALGCGAAFGRDVYAIRVPGTVVSTTDQGTTSWVESIRFFNGSPSDAIVSVLGASNGVALLDSSPLTVPAGKSAVSPDLSWEPNTSVPLFVLHLDVPDGVVASSRLYLEFVNNCAFPCPGAELRGAIPLPQFSALVPAGQEQVILDADLGDLAARLNLVLYNGGTDPSNALVQVRRLCDEGAMASVSVSIPPDTAILLGSVGPQPTTCDPFITSPEPGPGYLRVVMDQPGFICLATIANEAFSFLPVQVSSPSPGR